jgi:nucleosome assembly protein 1-like 1
MVTPDEALAELTSHMPEPVKKRVDALYALQDKIADVTKSFDEEERELHKKFMLDIAKLHAKFDKKYEPLYKERKGIVTGTASVAGGDKDGIPEYWATALQNCAHVSEAIEEVDVDVLKYLVDVRSETIPKEDGASGFKVIFEFKENPYFTNKELTKTVFATHDGEVQNVENCQINWKPGKNITETETKKKSKTGKGEAKTKTEVVPAKSFFSLFTDRKAADDEDDDEKEYMKTMHDQAAMMVFTTIREKVVPGALQYFFGVVDEEEDMSDMGQEFGEDEESDEDEDADE